MRKFKKLISAVTAGMMTLSMAVSMPAPVSAVELSAVDLVEDMGLGWNLGNTLDSVVQWEDTPSVSTVETGWGNVITTEAMIKAIKDSGFNTVRVPVTWSQGKDWSQDYTQNAEFMARVKEVVDYVINNDMYCILNMHHDEDWIEKDTSETKAKYESDWKTIADTFKDYDQHLVFEGTNECEFANDATQMTYNQLFVDTVRASGGNNAKRLCLVPANNNNMSKALSDSFSAPTDSAKMVAVSAHYYEPPQFCVADANASWGHLETWGSTSDVNTVANDFNKLKMKFVDNGIPVIIGEYGVVNADKYGVNSTNYNKDLDSIHKFVKTVASTAYNMKGICPVAWDDSNSGTILFFNRKELTWWDSDIQQIFKDISSNQVTDTPTFEKTDRVTVNFSDLTPDADGNYSIDLSPYAGQGAVVKSVILEGDVTGAGVGYGLGFEAYRNGGSTAEWSSETVILGSEGKATAELDGKSSYTDENTKQEVSYNYVLNMNYLQVQQWWKNSDDATAKLKTATLVFDKEISVASDSSEPSTEPPATEPPETSVTHSFTWEKDNWNFNNSSPDYFPKETRRNQIDDIYLEKLENSLTNAEYQTVFCGEGAWLDEEWGGSCYGMAATTLLSKAGLFPYADYKSGAVQLHDLDIPSKDRNVNSLMTYYQLLQVKEVIQNQYCNVPYRSHEENIKEILSELDTHDTVMVGFQKKGWGGHAILAYDYSYGSWTWNGVTYNGCIYVCDPNHSKSYDEKYNIYFNTDSYDWAIPNYYNTGNITSSYGAVFNYIGGSVDEINDGGYLSGTSVTNNGNYVGRIDAYTVAEDHFVSKVKKSSNNYVTQNTAADDIVASTIYRASGESKGTYGYNLKDIQSGYKVTQSKHQKMDLSIRYDNCTLSGSSAAGSEVIFDKNGYVSVSGENADFDISMTFNENYPTDWFTFSVSGKSSNNANMEMTDKGYILTADNLNDVSVHTNNKEVEAYVNFSTDAKSVLLYEIDEKTIGVSIDTDGDGTYETPVKASTVKFGDVDGNGETSIVDVLKLNQYLLSLTDISDEGRANADVDNNGILNDTDAINILKSLVGLVTLPIQ